MKLFPVIFPFVLSIMVLLKGMVWTPPGREYRLFGLLICVILAGAIICHFTL